MRGGSSFGEGSRGKSRGRSESSFGSGGSRGKSVRGGSSFGSGSRGQSRRGRSSCGSGAAEVTVERAASEAKARS